MWSGTGLGEARVKLGGKIKWQPCWAPTASVLTLFPGVPQSSEKIRRELLNQRPFWHAHVIQFYEVR